MVGRRWLFGALGVVLVGMLVAFGTVMRSTASASPAFQVATETATTTATAAVPTVAPHRCPLLRNPTMIPTDKSSPNRMLSYTLPTDSFTRIDWS